MAGSRNYFRYTNDSAGDFTVLLDESNAEATVGGVRLLLDRTANLPFLSSRTKKRFVNAYVTDQPLIKRKFHVGNPLAIPQILAGSTLTASVYPTTTGAGSTASWTITSYRGERTNIAPNFNAPDTGLTDGDGGASGGGGGA